MNTARYPPRRWEGGRETMGDVIADLARWTGDVVYSFGYLGVAALIALQNPELAARMDRTVTLREGRVVAKA